MKIAVDAMGGDFAPAEIIKGAVNGAKEYGVGVVLVGPQERIQAELAKYDCVENYLTPFTPVMCGHTGPVISVSFYSE